ncbi:hypothetical protein PRNP1_010419 [Phytophthora ramorum]
MTFSSALQLRIFGNHALDKKLTSPRVLAHRDEDNNAELRFSLSSDGKWPSVKREESFHATEHAGGESSGTLAAPVSSGGSIESVGSSSDWNVIPSNSFDDTYLEGDYSSSGMVLDSSSTGSIHHLNEPMNRLGLENGEHELPVFSMPYPGTSWFQGKNVSGNGNSFSLPAVGGPTPHSHASSTATTESSNAVTTSSCGPNLYSTAPTKLSGDVVPYPTDVPSPVQMDSFSPCHPYIMEPSELLFADMSNWDVHNNQHDQPFYNLSSHTATPNGYHASDDTGDHSSAMPTSLHDCTSSYHQHQLPSSVSTGSSMFRLMQSHVEAYPTDTRWIAAESCHHYSTPSTASTTPTGTSTNIERHSRDSDRGNQRPNTAESLRAASDGQTIKRILRSTSNQLAPHSSHPPVGMMPKAANSTLLKSISFPASSSVSSNQSAKVQLLTTLNDCYWKNGRKNLQCFPSCPEHHDFYSMKMNNRKHSSVGVCRGPVYCHAFTNASEFLPAASTQQMKHENGVGVPCGGSGAREVYVLGRFERVPQQEATNLLEELNTPPTFPNSEVFEQFRYTCFQAVEMEERRVLLPETSRDLSKQAPDSSKVKSGSAEAPAKKRIIRSTWFFLPDVWKVQPMLKKKRKATRSAPAQTFPFCFRIFIYTRDVDGLGYSCIASTASSFFELYSTRTVDRVKRKYWSGETARPMNQRKQRGLNRL